MATWSFTLEDRMSGPATKADHALEGLEKELKSTEKALRGLNKTAKETQLNKALGLDITRQQKESTRAILQNVGVEKIRLSLQRDAARQMLRETLPAERARRQEEKEGLRDAMRASKDLFRSRRKQAADADRAERQSLREALSASKALGREQRERHRHQMQLVALADRAFEKATHAAKLRNADVTRSFRAALSDVGSILGTIVTGAAAAAAGIAALGANFLVSTAQAADFGEAQRRSLMTRFGAVEGGRQYEALIEYSNRYGTSLQDTFQQFQQLSRAGFNQPQVMSLMQGAGDVSSVMGSQAAGGVLTAISQIMSKGVPQMEELQGQLAEHGINLASVLGEIGSARGGLGQSQVRQMISNRQISSMETISAVMRTIQRDFSHGGPLGSGMNERLGTLGGKIDLISTRWEIFKTRVGETSAFEPVNRFLGRVAELMDGNTASGQRFQATLNSIFKDLFGDLDKQDPAAIFRKLEQGIRDTIPMLRDAWTVIKGIADAIGTAAKVIETVYKIWGYTPIGAIQGAAGRALVSNTPPGAQRETSRSVDDAIANQQLHQANTGRRAGVLSFLGGLFGGDSVSPTAALAASAGLGPSVPAIRAGAMQAGRVVQVNGGINVSVDGVADGTTAQDIGQQVNDHVNRLFSSAASSQGG